jgi:hypothetical protein
MRRHIAPLPLAIFRVRGSQAQMGAQLGRAFVAAGGWEPVVDYYPRLPAMLLTLPLPPRARPAAQAVVRAAMEVPARRMAAFRRKVYPQYWARTVAMLEAAGLPARMAEHFAVMDVFQNAVGLVGRLGLIGHTRVGVGAFGMCSSLVAWGDATKDGTLLHARNFDFPGAGVWDFAPAVVFCDPDDGLRYGFVTTRGADVPGVTVFNEAGLTVATHTRFHRDVAFSQASVMDVAHDIGRRAATVADAVAVAKEHPIASTWGLLVSSGRERRSALIETTSRGVEAIATGASTVHQACTNRYRIAALAGGEVGPSAAMVVDSDMRFRRLERAASDAERGERLDVARMQRLLGDVEDLDCVDGDGHVMRAVGNNVASPMTVQSVVVEPEAARVHVSVGTAPTGWGPWATVDWSWEGDPGYEVPDLPSHSVLPRSGPHAGVEAAYRQYVEVSRRHLVGDNTRGEMGALAASWPQEPHFRFLAAVERLHEGDLVGAEGHLDAALRMERGTWRRAQYLLWRSRVRGASGKRALAQVDRDELCGLVHPDIGAWQRAAVRERRRAWGARRLRGVALNPMLVDAE